MSEKKLEEMTFEELVDHVSRNLHSGLLEGGGKEFKSRVHLWLGQAIYWSKESKEVQSVKGKKNHKGSGS